MYTVSVCVEALEKDAGKCAHVIHLTLYWERHCTDRH